MPAPLSSSVMKGRSVRVIVWSGTHKGKTGVLTYKANDWKGTIVAQDKPTDKKKVLQNVSLKDCWQIKVHRKPSNFGKESDSQYTKSAPRNERYIINEEKKKILEYVASLFPNMSNVFPIGDHNGFISLFHGGVLEWAHRHPAVKTAIGNAANTGTLGGGGIDGAISRAGGESLFNARLALPCDFNNERNYVGGAVMTIAGDIDADYVIHAVGPDFGSGDTNVAYGKLFNAYWNMLSQPCNFIAIPLLSAGIFRGYESLETIIGVGLLAIYAYMQHYGNKIAVLCAFMPNEQYALNKVYGELFTVKHGKPRFVYGNKSLLNYPQKVKHSFFYALKHGSLSIEETV